MRVFHATKVYACYEAIMKELLLRQGRNITLDKPLTHVSRNPFTQGSWALDVIGEDTNRAWIIECEIADDTPLAPDPADDAGEDYNGGWCVSEHPIPILKVHSVLYIQNVQRWEGGESFYAQFILEGS